MKNFKILFIVTLVPFFISSCNNEPTEIKNTTSISSAYQNLNRNQFHFSPESNWMNDPNGMFYYQGKYHLFYQYYPDSTVWGPMHWAHAESEDMINWKHLPIGLYPDSLGYIFSGGAVVDNNNTSQLGNEDTPPIVATFTHHNMEGEKAGTNDFQTQSVAYSLDGGYEWIKYKSNPVIENTEKIKDFRDPKVVWHEASQSWIMVLAAYDRAKFYSSKNLLDWKFISDFGIEGDTRLWECPDLFPIKVENTNEEKWVLITSIQKEAPNSGTGTSYFVGDFDGEKFISDPQKQKWLDWGTDNYAFVTWNNLPKNDGRVIGIGWMSNWQYAQIVPTQQWRSTMTLPRELKLYQSGSDYNLYNFPVEEFKQLREKSTFFDTLKVSNTMALEGEFSPSQSEIIFTSNLKETTADAFGLNIENELGEKLIVSFDKNNKTLNIDRTNSRNSKFSKAFFEKVHTAPLNFDVNTFDVRIILDAAAIEIFINDGAISMTDIFFPSTDFDKVSLFANNGEWSLSNCKIFALNGIW